MTGEAAQMKFLRQRSFVCSFGFSGSQFAMNLDRSADDLPRKFVDIHKARVAIPVLR